MNLMDWLYPNSKTPTPIKVPAKEKAMGIKLTGVWTRKPEMEFADVATVNRARAVVSNHPWSIVNGNYMAAEYGALFGTDELEVLRKSSVGAHYNLVASATQKWVLGGTWAPLPPKPEEVLQPGNVWLDTSFGRKQVPADQATTVPPAAVAELSPAIKQELASIVFQSVTDALEAWATKG